MEAKTGRNSRPVDGVKADRSRGAWGWSFYLAALGLYSSVWEERAELRRTLSERGEQTHTRLTRQVTDWQKQIREVLGLPVS